MKLVFLGTGSAIPSKERGHPAIHIHYRKHNFLLDCGEGTQRQMVLSKISLMKIDEVFITHWHADHFAGIMGLMQSMNLEGRKRPLKIFGPEADSFVSDILDLSYWGAGFEVIANPIPFEGNKITEIFKADEFKIFSIPVVHTVPSVAYCFKETDSWNIDLKKAKKFGLSEGPLLGKLKESGEIFYKNKKIKLEQVARLRKGLKIVYSGDTRPCTNLLKLAMGADLLIHDATFMELSKAKRIAHTCAKDAATIARKAHVKKLILTHLSRRYKTAGELRDAAKKIFPNTIVAKDFMQLEFKS